MPPLIAKCSRLFSCKSFIIFFPVESEMFMEWKCTGRKMRTLFVKWTCFIWTMTWGGQAEHLSGSSHLESHVHLHRLGFPSKTKWGVVLVGPVFIWPQPLCEYSSSSIRFWQLRNIYYNLVMPCYRLDRSFITSYLYHLLFPKEGVCPCNTPKITSGFWEISYINYENWTVPLVTQLLIERIWMLHRSGNRFLPKYFSLRF